MTYKQFLEDLSRLFLQLKENVIAFVPNLIAAIAVFLIGLLLAFIVQAIIKRFIRNLDRFISYEKLQNRIKHLRLERSAGLISKILFWIVIVFFLTAATEVLGLPIITTWLSSIVQYLPNIVVAVIIVFSGIIGGGLLRDIITTASGTAGLAYADIVGKVAYYTIIFVATLIAVNQVGVNIALLSSLISIVVGAILLGAALAFGLGARTSVNNILGSYYLQGVYREGFTIKVGEIEGKIIQIGPTLVILDTGEGQVSIPAKAFNETNTTLLKRD
jgi:hypothetical protein